MTVETNDEAVDLGRRGMMGRLGLVASVAIAAPVLMTMSTSALANHKRNNVEKSCGNGQADGQGNGADTGNGDGAENGTGRGCPGGWSSPPENDSGW